MSSSVSIRGSTYNCAYAKVDSSNAARAQSARIFDPRLNVPSFTLKDSNDPYSGRPSSHNAMNGVSGTDSIDVAGLNPQSYIMLTTDLRQVAYQNEYPNTTFYDTIAGANRSNFYSQRAGKSGGTCGVYSGPDSYTSTPQMSNCNGNGNTMTSVDRRNYLQALQNEYNQSQRM